MLSRVRSLPRLQRQRLALAAAFGVLLGLASASHAVIGGTVIGNFESPPDNNIEGYTSGEALGSVQTTNAFGATVGTYALQFQAPAPNTGFWGPRTRSLHTGSDRAAFESAHYFSVDVTMTQLGLSAGAGGFNGFAQTNEVVVQMFSNSGVNLFLQRNYSTAGVLDSLGQNAGWNGVDGTRTLVWNLDLFTGVDPADAQTKTAAAILANHPEMDEIRIWITAQAGQSNPPVGPSVFWYDNWRLSPVPEPGTLAALAGLVAPGLLVRRRRD